MTTPAKLLNATVRNQVYLESLKADEVNQFAAFLKRMDKALRLALTENDLTGYSRSRMEKLLRAIERTLNGIFTEYYDELAGHLIELGEYEAEFESRSLDNTLEGLVETVIPAPEQVRAAVFSTPLSVRGPDGGKLLEPFIHDWMHTDTKRLTGIIRRGFFEGQTNFEIIQALRGTRAARFTDGALNVVNRHAEAIVRTAVQHSASVARFETWKRNEDIVGGYRWVSTLDHRTSTICRSLDGEIFQLGKGPKPPVHIRCRSTTVAELSSKYQFLKKGRTRASKNGPVSASLTYYEWLKQQSPDFQDDVLGPSRGKLFREGGMSATKFQQLQIGKNFRPLTLKEMRDREPRAFDRLDPDLIASEERARSYVVSNGRQYGGEFAYAGNPSTGDFLFKKRGQSSSVSFTNSEIRKLERNPSATLYHNHPSGSSLSQADLEFTAQTGIKEIVAFATEESSEFRASVNIPVQELRSVYKRTDAFIRDRMYPLIKNNTVTIPDANATHAHFVNTLLDKNGAIKYQANNISDRMDKALQRMQSIFEEWLNDYDIG